MEKNVFDSWVLYSNHKSNLVFVVKSQMCNGSYSNHIVKKMIIIIDQNKDYWSAFDKKILFLLQNCSFNSIFYFL